MTAHMPDNQEPEHSQQVQGSVPAQYQGPDAAGHFAGNLGAALAQLLYYFAVIHTRDASTHHPLVGVSQLPADF
jgi:hypothetical protein